MPWQEGLIYTSSLYLSFMDKLLGTRATQELIFVNIEFRLIVNYIYVIVAKSCRDNLNKR